MLRHMARATPWPLLVAAATVIAVLLRIVEEWPYTMWPLQGVAIGVLAGSAVWAFDEPAAAIVDALPRSLLWRTTARSGGVLALTAIWVALVGWTHTAYFDHADKVAAQGCAAVVCAVALVTWLRGRGVAAPAGSAGSAIVACTTFIALSRPYADMLPVFPYLPNDAWAASATGWTVAAIVAACVLVAVLGEVRTVRPGGPAAVRPATRRWTP